MGRRSAQVCLALAACALLALGSNARTATPRFVAIADGPGMYNGHWGSGTLAITEVGEVYFRLLITGSAIGPWVFESSVPASDIVAMSAGKGASGSLGMRVFCESGAVYYRANAAASPWVFDSHIGASGIVGIGYGVGGSPTYLGGDQALTSEGVVYFRPDASCCRTWRLDGQISAPTELAGASWGAVKARYR